MNFNQQVYQHNLSQAVIQRGGSIVPLLLPAAITNGTGIMNPSIFVDGDQLLCNIRHVNYTLYHSENKKFQHRYGPLQYLHPEDDQHLRTWNHLCVLNRDWTINRHHLVDTQQFDQDPLWEFVGLEDARIVRWNNRLYYTGVRRDTTVNGQGRMELSEIDINDGEIKETQRIRIPSTGLNDSYCEKNWMPIVDQPYHYVKWSNPTEVVKFDPNTKSTVTVALKDGHRIGGVPDFRGGSQVLPYRDNYYVALVHEVDLYRSPAGEKDAVYRHRILVWDRQWNLVRYTNSFSFMGADIEFCCGAAFVDNEFVISFGYQDNCAFLLRMSQQLLDQLIWHANSTEFGQLNFAPPNIDWGLIQQNAWFRHYLEGEIFVDRCYEKFVKVQPQDLVVDIGASVGPWLYQLENIGPSKVICLEPHPELFAALNRNANDIDLDIVTVNKAIGSSDGMTAMSGLFDSDQVDISPDGIEKFVDTMTWATLIEQHQIDKINFLKLDCEGGEYHVFTEKNQSWIFENVEKIAMEIHLATPEEKQKFRQFRDQYLTKFQNFQVWSLDWVDIKWSVWDDWFIDRYQAVMIYIDNSENFARSLDTPIWQKYPAATLEITTIVPEKGCVVDCVFCPQRILEQRYRGERILTLENFKKILDRVPQSVRITFAGFTEPWMNKYCTDMVVYAHQKGHPISVFTTGVGVSVADVEILADLPYAGNPNGGFVLHLPDSEMLARHPITPGYLNTLSWIKHNQHRIQNFSIMTMGVDVHPEIKHIFDRAPNYQMWSRAGNLVRESLLKPRLLSLKDRWNTSYQAGEKTCGCVEHLYHNVLLPNGDVSLCCMDYGLEHILGNLHQQTYEDVIPQDQQCFSLCNYCENATDPQPIKFI